MKAKFTCEFVKCRTFEGEPVCEAKFVAVETAKVPSGLLRIGVQSEKIFDQGAVYEIEITRAG